MCEIQDRVYVEMDGSVNGVRYVMVLQCRVASRKCFEMSIWAGTFGAIPVAYAEDCARAAVLGVLRSRRYVWSRTSTGPSLCCGYMLLRY